VTELMREYCSGWYIDICNGERTWSAMGSKAVDACAECSEEGDTELDARWALLIKCFAADHPEMSEEREEIENQGHVQACGGEIPLPRRCEVKKTEAQRRTNALIDASIAARAIASSLEQLNEKASNVAWWVRVGAVALISIFATASRRTTRSFKTKSKSVRPRAIFLPFALKENIESYRQAILQTSRSQKRAPMVSSS
jgi:hypothetical protein